ncbi:MAG: hypothetical protein ACR2QW_08765 [bacterium]
MNHSYKETLMGRYWDDPVTRHIDNVWDAKVDARISALNWEIDKSFIDSRRTQLEIDRVKGDLDEIYEYSAGYGGDSEERRVDRFMQFIERGSIVELANEFGSRRAMASSRVEMDRRLPASTKIELPELINKLSFTNNNSKELVKKLVEATNQELEKYNDEPHGFEYVMALYDIKEDLWYLQQLLVERDSRN